MNRSKTLTLLKLSLVGLLLYFLASKGFISIHATQHALKQWDRILEVALLLFASLLLGVFRWQWLLEAHDIVLPWSRVFQLTLIGNFFNIALPGAVSGDFVKAFYIGRDTQKEKSKAFGSILFDRVAGLSGLVLVSTGALALGLQSYLDTPLIHGIRLLLGCATAGVFLFYSYLFFVKEKRDLVLQIFQRLESRFKKAGVLTRLYLSLRHYHHHRGTVLKVLAISILIHLAVGWGCFRLAQTLGESQLSSLSTYVVVPLGLLVTAIPVAPGGIGTGNLAFLYFFNLIGSERGADIYSLYALINIALSSLGALVFFRFRTRPQLEPVHPFSQ